MTNPILKSYTTADLEAEIERRRAGKPPMPELTGRIELEALLKLCKQYISDLHEYGRVDEDMHHYIFEAAMQAFYGKDIFIWINKQTG
jgi:hypothetical protein